MVVLFMFRRLIVLADWLVQQQICDLVCVTVGPIMYLISGGVPVVLYSWHESTESAGGCCPLEAADLCCCSPGAPWCALAAASGRSRVFG
eukprot:COSAG01_NODE_162_length_23597_cov_21.924130_26_plen_90_part_00